MMAFEIVPFEWRHLAMLEPGEIELEPLGEARIAEMARRTGPVGFAGAAIENGHVLGCAGIVMDPAGVSHAWIVASDEMRRRPFVMFRAIKCGLDFVERRLRPKEMRISVKKGHEPSRRFAERLGFKLTGEVSDEGLNGHEYLVCKKWQQFHFSR